MRVRNVGAHYMGNGQTGFTVWAPFREKVEVVFKSGKYPALALQKDDAGYWTGRAEDTSPETLYQFRLDDEISRPDPASRAQPEGVHDYSQVVPKDNHNWSEISWQPPQPQDLLIYELHPGTFTSQGDFDGIASRLDHLLELGINAIEIMPVAHFPGSRNWGYDGVYPFAVHTSYGGSKGLKKLVDTCHRKGVAVILDVVYNHMGPEGNYLHDYGPYFTDKYNTPWGAAINFDDAHCDPVREFVLQNALMWFEEFRIDALRLDAVHAIYDHSAKHILKEMREWTDELEKRTGNKHYLIAESDLNDVRLISNYQGGGFNLDAQWADDFHHSVHALLTGERRGYYSDFGNLQHLAKSFRQGFVYDGEYSEHRKRRIGNDPSHQPPSKFVVAIQNHDQVGNRKVGDRLSQLVNFELQKTAAGLLLISPYIPLLFMGEEYAEDRPFQYFVSHGDADLVQAVREGRRREFESFDWKGEVPDPQSEETFKRSTLQWNWNENEQKTTMFRFYQELIKLRKAGTFSSFVEEEIAAEIRENERVLVLRTSELLAVVNLDDEQRKLELNFPGDNWKKILATADEKWLGPADLSDKPEGEMQLQPHSLMVFTHN